MRRDHHEDEVRQVLLLPLVQVIQVQALVLLVHALITDTVEANFSGFFFVSLVALN